MGIHSSGFKDFLLKPELLRAIQDCGFEHPSEGRRPDAALSLKTPPLFGRETPGCLLPSKAAAGSPVWGQQRNQE